MTKQNSRKKSGSFLSYLCPWAAVPYGCWHTGTPITGLHLCWFFPDALPCSCTLSDPSSSQTHHLSPLHSRATLCRTLVETKWKIMLSITVVRMLVLFLPFSVFYSQCWTSQWSTSWLHMVPCCTLHFQVGGSWSCTPSHSLCCLHHWHSAHSLSSSLPHSPLSTVIDIQNKKKT